MRFPLLVLFVVMEAVAGAKTPLVDDTHDAACGVLKKHIIALRKLDEQLVMSKWFCDFSIPEDTHMYVVALHSDRPAPYSSLIGWYAVMRRSDVVLGYDVAEDRVVSLENVSDSSSK
jgi:hypothetical protein